MRRQFPLQIKITIFIHEKSLHDFRRSFKQSYVSRYFSAIAIACASPSAGLLTILYVRTAGFSGTTVLTMLTVFSLNEVNSSMNVTQTHSTSNRIIFPMIFLLKNNASFTVVEVNISFSMIMLFGVA